MKRALFVLFLGLATSGCRASGVDLTRERAAYDFKCSEDRVLVAQVSGETEKTRGAVFGARGCGKRATYIRQHRGGVTLNSAIEEDR